VRLTLCLHRGHDRWGDQQRQEQQRQRVHRTAAALLEWRRPPLLCTTCCWRRHLSWTTCLVFIPGENSVQRINNCFNHNPGQGKGDSGKHRWRAPMHAAGRRHQVKRHPSTQPPGQNHAASKTALFYMRFGPLGYLCGVLPGEVATGEGHAPGKVAWLQIVDVLLSERTH
jgi:hypothetical protein